MAYVLNHIGIIDISVPSDNAQNDIEIFEGEVNSTIISWVNPILIFKNQPVMPNTVANIQFNEKFVVDSLGLIKRK